MTSSMLGASFVGMATARCAHCGLIDRNPSRSPAPFDLLPGRAREKGRTREPMCLCCLIDGIEETGIERQISPYRSAGVKKQWHYGVRYIALVDGMAGAYGVVVPDLPGCTSAGSTTDEALRNTVEAVRLWVEDAIDDGEALPTPRSVEALRADPEIAAALTEGAALAGDRFDIPYEDVWHVISQRQYTDS